MSSVGSEKNPWFSEPTLLKRDIHMVLPQTSLSYTSIRLARKFEVTWCWFVLFVIIISLNWLVFKAMLLILSPDTSLQLPYTSGTSPRDIVVIGVSCFVVLMAVLFVVLRIRRTKVRHWQHF